MAGRSFTNARLRASTTPSITCATSRTSRVRSATCFTGIAPISAADLPCAATRTMASVAPRSAVPTGASTFCVSRASITCASDRPYASRRFRSTTTWISRLASPTRFTAPTPGTFSSRRLTSLSAISDTARGVSAGASTATDTIGAALGSIRWMMGSSISRGRSPRIAATLPRMSCDAFSVGTPMLNCTTMLDRPSCEPDSMWRTPSTVLIDSSIFLVTSRSTVSGDAPA